MFTIDSTNVKSKLVFVQVTQNVANLKVFFPDIPELIGRKIVGIETYDRGQLNGTLSTNNNIAPANITRLVVINLVDKDKNVIIRDMPFRGLQMKRFAISKRRIINPFYFELFPRLSYIYLTGTNVGIGTIDVVSIPINFFYV